MNVINNLVPYQVLNTIRKKTKAMWIGSAKNNVTKPLGFESFKERIKSLGINLSYKHENNDNLNFKIYKMDTKLNIWQTRGLTLFGHTMLVKTLGLFKLVYSASMMRVPEMVIKRIQEKIRKFLWKNKIDK